MPTIICGPSCEWIFDRLQVFADISGGTRVEWTLHPQFSEAGPYTFQLQAGRTGNPDADDWTDVGAAVVDTYFVVDSSKRVYGKKQWTHYRVTVTSSASGADTYASKPQPATGNLNKKDWLRSKAILRNEDIRLRKEAGQEGYLLKRRLYGTACPDCLDYQTGEVRNPQCSTCYGTGFTDGYFAPYGCFYAELGVHAHRSEIQDSARGTIDDLPRTTGRMINTPQVFSYDVWVDKDSDFRWIIHSVKNLVEVRGIPIIVQAEMRLAPFTHPVYSIDITGQVPA